MNSQELKYFKSKLEAEKATLISELGDVGQKNPDNPNDWQATSSNIEVDKADENEVADKLEELEGNHSIVNQLESQLAEVNAALERIEKGTFGACEVCGKAIEKERLEANPAARSSIKHSH